MDRPILGIDTWAGQLEIDEAVLKANDIKFMFIRLNSMSGGHHKDTGFDKQWSEAAGFCHAPYFVYNPWVTGLANFEWLYANMPKEAKLVGCDIEVAMAGYSPAVYANEVLKFNALVDQHWHNVTYTGQGYLYLLSQWELNRDYWWAEYPLEFYPSAVTDMTWDEIRQRLTKYNWPLNVEKVPGRTRLWQFSGDKIRVPGNASVLDLNVFYGTEQELNNLFGAPSGATPPSTPPGDLITTPFAGCTHYVMQRNGVKVIADKLELSKVKIEVYDVTGGVARLSTVATNTKAVLGVNGADWNKYASIPYPYGPSVSNGVTHVKRGEAGSDMFDPAMIIYRDGTATIDHVDRTGQYNVSAGVRYLIYDEAISPALYGTELEFKELHSRGLTAILRDGSLLFVTVEGFKTISGMTLLQCATFLQQEFGCVKAFDRGSGGDAETWLMGKVLNIPDDRDDLGNPVERYIPQFILVYPKETNNTMPTYTVTAKADGVKIYKNPDGTSQIATLNLGASAKGDGIYGELMHLSSLKGSLISGYVFLSKINYVADPIVVTPPPTTPPPTGTTHHLQILIDGKVIEDKDFTI